jgi:hypothetical protein
MGSGIGFLKKKPSEEKPSEEKGTFPKWHFWKPGWHRLKIKNPLQQ